MGDFLADIHLRPDDPLPKLAYADWWDQFTDSRAQLIFARESLRQTPIHRSQFERFLETAADFLGVSPARVEITARLRELLELRTLLIHEADCADRVLRVYERQNPNDDRPRLAIAACRDFAARKINAEKLLDAASTAREAADESDEPGWSVAIASATAADFFNPYGSSSAAMLADAVVEMVARPYFAEDEAVWQLTRLVDLWLFGWDFPLPESERHAI